MSAGVSGMITSLRANKNLLRKRDHFPKSSQYGRRKSTVDYYIFPKATKKQLRNIRKKMQKERKILIVKRTGAFLIIVSLIVYGFLKYF